MGNGNSLCEVTEGYYPAISAAYAALNKKYGNDQDPEIVKRLAAILELKTAMENDMKNQRELTVRETLTAIENDVLSYIQGDAGEVMMGNIDGGGSKTTVVRPTMDSFKDNTLMGKQGQPSVLDEPTMLNVKPVNQTQTQNRITQKQALTDTQLAAMQNAFKEYAATQLTSYEAIKNGNAIINRAARTKKSIRPNIIKLLVNQMIEALISKKEEEINRYTFSLIQWYLLHNETKGIGLTQYNTMLQTMRTPDESLKPFIDMLNSYLYHL